MHQSLNLDNIPDDALFESGTGSWNQNFQQGSSTFQQGTLSDRTNTIGLHNLENASNASITEHQSHDMMNGELQDNRRQVLARSQSPPERLLAVFDAINDPPLQRLPQQSAEHGGARAKTYRNKENRNKNSVKKKNGYVTSNEEKVRDQQNKSRDVSAGWEPSLQFKRYSDDDDEFHGSETTCRKVINQSKQRKQNMNKNMMKNQSELAPPSKSGSDDSLLNVARIPLPAGIDPVSNPRNISNIYVKNINRPVQNEENDLETDFYSVHHKDNNIRAGNCSQSLFENPNVKHIHNNLWEGQIKDKNSSRIGQIKVDQGKTTIPVVRNMQEDENTTVIKFASPINLHRQPSDSGLNASIVVPYELSGSADNLMQLTSTSTGSSPHDLVSSFNTSPTTTLSNSLGTDSLHFSESLPSNLSSNVLFGDGISDYIYAQKLQQEFDREHKEIQRLRQYDIIPHETRFRVTNDNSYNNANAATENRTLDYVTANEYQTLNDSLTNNITPVYDTRDEERQTESQNIIYIPCENRVENLEEQLENETCRQEINSAEADIERVGESPEATETHQLQNDEQYPTTHLSRDPIYIPYNEDSRRIVQPEPSLPNSLLARGSVARQPTEPLDDAEIARRLQEQQDEEYARRLQEEESEEEHHHEHGNHHGDTVNIRNMERNNTRRNYQPLHSRFGHTWRNRPLRVGPPLGVAGNNVADSRVRSRNTWDRPLQQRSDNNEFAYLDTVHSLSSNEGYDIPPGTGYDIPPGQDYYYRYQNDPDLMLDDNGEDRLVSINRDPQLLATLLMTRAPDMMIPNHIDLNDYEALWELAENLGEVRRVGMDENDISMLPVHTYKPSPGNNDDSKTDCLVCLSEFEEGENLRTLPCCHIYHVDCIDEWLRRNAVCPVCRQSAAHRD